MVNILNYLLNAWSYSSRTCEGEGMAGNECRLPKYQNRDVLLESTSIAVTQDR